ncbi:PQQ-binding-like beta-propeller repeat protein [Planctomicrobium piriforme]|uniref:Outer membrane protein assembly factor BamB n=1 Tax=Planctomicrobium piriforme TaxID=1576369 RepID=A0A1I3K115_9PLAN|nr:PQQ-binding-like beta-propeller repeat protein [Planctomicrobium piriforme]SFI66116.1 outer membrane protein assembly factor BamB [Planctomicrobium piriforme]
MSERPLSVAQGDSSSAGNTTSPRRKWRIVDLLLVGLLVLIAVSQVLVWNVWEPALGLSIKNLVSYSEYGLAAIAVTAWWFLFAPVSRNTRLLIGLPVLLLAATWGASIRRVDLSGDMAMTFRYRWQPETRSDFTKPKDAPTQPVSAENIAVPVAMPEDMPAFRGVNRDGNIVSPPLMTDWTAHPLKELWRKPCGGGYGSFAVVGDFAVSLEQRGADEAIVCYDVKDGRERWEYRYPSDFFEALGGEGPRSTPTIEGNRVYSFGAFGDLCCLDFLTGEKIWHVNGLQQFGTPNCIWGMTSSPLVFEGNVIVNVGGLTGDGLAAYKIEDGTLVWHGQGLTSPVVTSNFATGPTAVTAAGKSAAGYSSPMLRTLHGQLQLLNFDGTALRGCDPSTGRQLWSFPWVAGDNVSVAQPIVFDDGRIFISTSYGKGSCMLQVKRDADNWTADEIWSNINMRCKFTSPVLIDGSLYGIDEGIMVCLDPSTGKRKWKGGKTGLRGRYDHGQILRIDTQIIALTETGTLVLIAASPESLQELATHRVLPDDKVWNTPAIARGKLFVRNANEMACYELPVGKE